MKNSLPNHHSGYLRVSAGHPGLSTVSDAGKITGCKWLWKLRKGV